MRAALQFRLADQEPRNPMVRLGRTATADWSVEVFRVSERKADDVDVLGLVFSASRHAHQGLLAVSTGKGTGDPFPVP